MLLLGLLSMEFILTEQCLPEDITASLRVLKYYSRYMVGAEWIPECNLGKWSRVIRLAINLFKSDESLFVPVLTEGPSNLIIERFYKNLHKEIRQVLS